MQHRLDPGHQAQRPRADPRPARPRRRHLPANDTLKAANTALIEHQACIGLAQVWGGGHVASVGGMRFVVPVQTLNARHSPHFWGQRRGATWLNKLADLPDQKLWRIDTRADYGPFTTAARGRVDLERVRRNWEDILRVTASIHTGPSARTA